MIVTYDHQNIFIVQATGVFVAEKFFQMCLKFAREAVILPIVWNNTGVGFWPCLQMLNQFGYTCWVHVLQLKQERD